MNKTNLGKQLFQKQGDFGQNLADSRSRASLWGCSASYRIMDLILRDEDGDDIESIFKKNLRKSQK